MTRLRCGGIFNDSFIANFLQIVIVKEFLKIGQYLMKLCLKYPRLFFPDTMYIKLIQSYSGGINHNDFSKFADAPCYKLNVAARSKFFGRRGVPSSPGYGTPSLAAS